MLFQNILFVLLCIAIALISVLPEIIYFVFKKKKLQVGSFKLVDILLIVLGLIFGVILVFVINSI